MLLNVCTILVIICVTVAQYHRDYSGNVGTVLFSTEDRAKEQWTPTEMSLLRARKYFQSVLPPPGFTNNFREDYINIFLDYCRNAYENVKRESMDKQTDTIMTTALSDALGGYLKTWVLPTAKLDFYGGTISQENILKLYEFYKELKLYLDTDGKAWHGPRDTLFNTFTINVAPLNLRPSIRNMDDPCDLLAYFEKTSNGLNIPLPTVTWNNHTSVMFVPLKNTSAINLSTPDKDNALTRYYDIAKRCLARSNPSSTDTFEKKFQLWLLTNIIPHLKDDNIYLPFGKVLSLVNGTNDCYENIVRTVDEPPQCMNEIKPTTTTTCVCYRKLIILAIVLMVEIAWCIPAILYLICRKKKVKDSRSNVYLYVDRTKYRCDNCSDMDSFACGSHTCSSHRSLNRSITHSNKKEVYIQNTILNKNTETNTDCPMIAYANTTTSLNVMNYTNTAGSDFEAQYPSRRFKSARDTTLQSYFTIRQESFTNKLSYSSTQMRQKKTVKRSEVPLITNYNDEPFKPKNINNKKKSSVSTQILNHNNQRKDVNNISSNKYVQYNVTAAQNAENKEHKIYKNCNCCKITDNKRSQELRHEVNKEHKTVPRKRDHESKSENRNDSHKQSKECKTSKTRIDECKKVSLKHKKESRIPKSTDPPKILEPNVPRNLSEAQKLGQNFRQSCLTEGRDMKLDPNMLSHSKQDHKPELPCIPCIDTEIITQAVESSPSLNKDSSFIRTFTEHKPDTVTYKYTKYGNPFLEITINKPATGVPTSGLTNCNIMEDRKPSRIPKLNVNYVQRAEVCNKTVATDEQKNQQNEVHKSLIPQSRKKTVDDGILIERARVMSKLNKTL